MDTKFKMPGSSIATVIAALLLVIIILLVVDMNRRDRSLGEKIESAVEELQR